jgi:hypothetical protein
MHSPLRTASIAGAVVFVALAVTVLGQRPQTPAPPTAGSAAAQAEVTKRIVTAAQAVVATLDDAGRAKVQFPFEGAQKARWSNLPSGIFKREGLRLGDLTPVQRNAVMSLLSVALSRDGLRKVTEIMRGDEVLRETQGGRGPRAGGPRGGGGGVVFGQDEYYLAFVGTPSATAPWMLQFGGHHLAVNLTLAGSQATMAPSLPAAQPAS